MCLNNEIINKLACAGIFAQLIYMYIMAMANLACCAFSRELKEEDSLDWCAEENI